MRRGSGNLRCGPSMLDYTIPSEQFKLPVPLSTRPFLIMVQVHFLVATALLLTVGLAAPAEPVEERAVGTATVAIPSPKATILGNVMNKVESFGGIPYADPPTRSLRLRPPQRLTRALGTFDGTGPAGACPQFVSSIESTNLLLDLLGTVANIPFVQNVTGQSEDCLTITVARPQGTKAGANLPVLYWIFGGGFEVGPLFKRAFRLAL